MEREDERVLRIFEMTIDGSDRTTIGADDELLNLLPDKLSHTAATEVVAQIRQTIYVSAVRQVETDVFPAPEEPNPIHAAVGAFGEFAPWWFHHYDDMEVEIGRCLSSETSRTLRAQVNAWLRELFPGAEVNAQPVPKTRLMRLELRTGITDEWRRPSNTGYGISYAFPVLVAALCAKPNQTLIVDSPEAHLHPRGQSRIGRFLAQVAASGLQIIVETHSDHVLNGLRLALKDQSLRPEDTAIYFFGGRDTEGKVLPVVAVSADKNGNLDQWPDGFFDQAERDLANLAGWV